MARKRPASAPTPDPEPEQEPKSPPRRRGRPPKHDPSTWTVTDDWPERVPVTAAEVDVFESYFGDLFDELFGPDGSSRLRKP